jgi:hypothetical protein
MPRTPTTEQELRQLLATARTDGVTVHVAALIRHGEAVLLVASGGDGFLPTTWELPTALLLSGDTLPDVLDRAVSGCAGLELSRIGRYLDHHDRQHCDATTIRTFCLAVTVTDPTRTRRNALLGHQWIRIDELPPNLPDSTTAHSRYFVELAAGMPTTQFARQPPPLATALRAHARGLYPAEAATELLINHATWLHRADFIGRFVNIGVDFVDDTTPIAHIDWPAATAALNAGHLPCSAGEGRVLRLTVSLAHGIPIDLRDALTGLDPTNINLAAQAVRHTGGHRPT